MLLELVLFSLGHFFRIIIESIRVTIAKGSEMSTSLLPLTSPFLDNCILSLNFNRFLGEILLLRPAKYVGIVCRKNRNSVAEEAIKPGGQLPH